MSETPQDGDVWERYGKRFCCEGWEMLLHVSRRGRIGLRGAMAEHKSSQSVQKLIERDGKAVEDGRDQTKTPATSVNPLA